MMLEEFENLSGLYPSWNLWEEINALYSEFDGDKAAFVKAYKKNKDFIASRAQNNANMKIWKKDGETEKALETLRKSEDEWHAECDQKNEELEYWKKKFNDGQKTWADELDKRTKELEAVKKELDELKAALGAFKKILNEVA